MSNMKTRKVLVFVLLSLMSVSLVALLATRPRAAHSLPKKAAAAQREKATAAKGTAKGSAAAAKAASKKATAKPVKRVMKRALRLVCLRWAPCAPAIVANGGTSSSGKSTFKSRGLDLAIGARNNMRAIESALAAGGKVDAGADIAIVPLSELVAARTRLAAMSPRIFLVTGWSKGGYELVVANARTARWVFQRSKGRSIDVSGRRGDPATLLALFSLDLSGVRLDRVSLTPRKTSARFSDLIATNGKRVRGLAYQRTVLSTSDARRLVPYVAVAPRGFATKHPKALVRFSDVWFAGVKRVASDAPAAARALASIKRADHDSGRRTAGDMLAALGHIAPSPLADNARMLGLSGRPPLTLDWLYRKTHQLWHAAGLLAERTPAHAPIDSEVLARLIRERPIAALGAAGSSARDDARADQPTLRFSRKRSRTLLLHRSSTRSTRTLSDRVAVVAAVFNNATIRVRHSRGKRAAERVCARAAERFEIAGGASRLVAGHKTRAAAATIAVTVQSAR